MVHKINVGDSYWLQIEGDISIIDINPANWTGTWSVAATVGGTSVIDGSIYYSGLGNTFILKIAPSQTALLSQGIYYLTIQMENINEVYTREIAHDKVIVTVQGVA